MQPIGVLQEFDKIEEKEIELDFKDVAPITRRPAFNKNAGTVSLATKTMNVKTLMQEQDLTDQRHVGFKIDVVNKIIALAFYSEPNDITLQIHFNTNSSKVYLPVDIIDAIKPILNKDKFGNSRKMVKYFKYQNYFCFSYANGGD